MTPFVCPWNSRSCLPVPASHTRTVRSWSSDPVTSVLPSAVTARSVTASVWPTYSFSWTGLGGAAPPSAFGPTLSSRFPPFDVMSAVVSSSSSSLRKCSGPDARLKPKLWSMPRTHSQGSGRTSSNTMYSGVCTSKCGGLGGTRPPFWRVARALRVFATLRTNSLRAAPMIGDHGIHRSLTTPSSTSA